MPTHFNPLPPAHLRSRTRIVALRRIGAYGSYPPIPVRLYAKATTTQGRTPLAKPLPRLTTLTPGGKGTSCGDRMSAGALPFWGPLVTPTCLMFVLLPHPSSAPSVVTASVWPSPHATLATRRLSCNATDRNVPLLGLRRPRPSWPQSFLPADKSLPSVVSTVVWKKPHETCAAFAPAGNGNGLSSCAPCWLTVPVPSWPK